MPAIMSRNGSGDIPSVARIVSASAIVSGEDDDEPEDDGGDDAPSPPSSVVEERAEAALDGVELAPRVGRRSRLRAVDDLVQGAGTTRISPARARAASGASGAVAK